MIDPVSDLRHLRSERIDWLLTVLTGVLISAPFYMSFVTLTSTGYGDIVPVHPFATILEASIKSMTELFAPDVSPKIQAPF
jgi:hypothetical protein